MNLLSCLMLPMIVARALRSLISVSSCNCARTYCSAGVQSSHFQLGSYWTTGASITGGSAISVIEGYAQAELVSVSAVNARVRFIIIKIIFAVVPSKNVAIIEGRGAVVKGLGQDIIDEELTSLFIVDFSRGEV